MSTSATILITGVTGFIGSHLAVLALQKGYKVIGSMRKLTRADSIRAAISKQATTDNLRFVEAELMDANAWDIATRGVDYVLHVASPFPTTLPKNDDEVVIPAREGVLNVLRAASSNGVKRVVLTSSSGAAMYGNRRQGTFTEEDWTNVNNLKDTSPYFRSKTIAEQAAWDFIK
ncbi:MAG: NAD-dependent epimerase/dehydratase family protein, partial [Bacteroidota bacterium]